MEIKININDEHLDIGAFVSTFAAVGNVTINIFTREEDLEESDTLLVGKDTVKVTDKPEVDQPNKQELLLRLSKLEGEKQTAMADELHSGSLILSWTELGDALNVKGNTLYRRCKSLREKGKRKDKKAKKAKKEKVKPKAKPKPVKPSVPNLSEYEIIEAVYGVIQGNPSGVHFANTISSTMIASYSNRYKADTKLDEFKTSIGERIDTAVNKIALVLGHTNCMVTRAQESNGQFSLQIMVYNKNIPELDTLWGKLKKLNVLN
jgi:hypothetical protein